MQLATLGALVVSGGDRHPECRRHRQRLHDLPMPALHRPDRRGYALAVFHRLRRPTTAAFSVARGSTAATGRFSTSTGCSARIFVPSRRA
jgi:hypothetical protein